MANYSEIIDMFADLQKNIHREIGTLMGQMLGKAMEPTKVVEPTKTTTTTVADALALDKRIDGLSTHISGIEHRIMEAIESRFAALQTPIRRQEEVPEAPAAPTKGQTTLSAFVQEAPVRKLDLNVAITPEKKEVIVVNKVADTSPEGSVVEEEEEEATSPEGSVVEEEETTSPEGSVVEEEEEAEELTEFMYKGTKYFMDSECNVYGLTADGELNDEPVGTYNVTTRRITFVAA